MNGRHTRGCLFSRTSLILITGTIEILRSGSGAKSKGVNDLDCWCVAWARIGGAERRQFERWDVMVDVVFLLRSSLALLVPLGSLLVS